MNKRRRLKYARKELEKIAGKVLTLGDLLRAIRLSEGETLSDFASRLQTSLQHLSDLEKGRRGLSPERAAKFAIPIGAPEELFVQLAIQDQLDRVGLNHLRIQVLQDE